MDQLVDESNSTYHRSIKKKPIQSDYSALTKEIESSNKAPKFKVGDRFRIPSCKSIFSKFYRENWSREIFLIDSLLKYNPRTYKMKDLNGEKKIRKHL